MPARGTPVIKNTMTWSTDWGDLRAAFGRLHQFWCHLLDPITPKFLYPSESFRAPLARNDEVDDSAEGEDDDRDNDLSDFWSPVLIRHNEP